MPIISRNVYPRELMADGMIWRAIGFCVQFVRLRVRYDVGEISVFISAYVNMKAKFYG